MSKPLEGDDLDMEVQSKSLEDNYLPSDEPLAMEEQPRVHSPKKQAFGFISDDEE